MAMEQIRDSRLPLHVEPMSPTTAPFLTLGEYTIMPMESCSEDQVAKLFAKVCQRGNPVLQGRPMADLMVLGRAMYRKSTASRTGNIAMYRGEPVALGCGWDIADGGVWAGSNLEMPASLRAHAACGKAAFDSFVERKQRERTYFSAFYGVLPPHNVKLFGFCGYSNFCIAHKLGFQDSFQYTLIPTLTKKGLFSAKDNAGSENINYPMPFAEVPSDIPEVLAELVELNGNINLSLTSLDFIMTPTYQKMAAAICGMKGPELFKPSDLIATNQLDWIQAQTRGRITSRL